MRGWGTRRRWPPAPCVEDEQTSLAHELTDGSTTVSKSDDEAQSKGTIEQYPIILDTDLGLSKSTKQDWTRPNSSGIDSQSSDDSVGPPTPPSTTSDRPRSRQTVPDSISKNVRDQSRPQPEGQGRAEGGRRGRERPAVSPLNTVLDPEIQHMLSGRRRAPSPYRMTKPENEEPASGKGNVTGDFLLSPEAVPPQYQRSEPSRRRVSSAQPSKERNAGLSSSEDQSTKHHHRRHSSRLSYTNGDQPVVEESKYRDSRSSRDPEQVSSKTESTVRVENQYRPSRRDDGSDSERRRTKLDYGSSADESRHHRREHSRGPRDSHGKEREGRSPRPSFSGGKRPEVDIEPSRHKRQSTLEVPGAASADSRHRRRDRSRSRTRDKSPGRHSEHIDRDERTTRLDITTGSSSDEMKPRHHEGSQIRERDAVRRSARPSFSNAPRSVFDIKDARGSADASPSTERPPERRHQDSYVSRRDYAQDKPAYRESLSKTSSQSSTDWDKAFKDNINKRMHTPLSSAIASPRSSPDQTPPLTPRTTRPPSDFSTYTGLGLASQGVQPSSKTPSRASTIDDYPLERANGPRHPSMLSHSARSSSDFSADLRQRQVPIVPASIEPRPTLRTSTYGSSQMEPPRMAQRAHSYSTTDLSHHYEDVRRQRVPQPASQYPSSLYSSHPSTEKLSRVASNDNIAARLAPCPRSKPVAGWVDWYTLSGLPQLNFCPSCMRTLGNSRFREQFVPQYSPSAKQEISCTLSQPWFRLAWIQTIKQKRPSLEMIHDLVELSQDDTKPCPGKKRQVRSWFSAFDPDTDTPISEFDACSHCIRSVRILFPKCKEVFDRRSSSKVQEKVCDLDCKSPRFERYMGILEDTTLQSEGKRLGKTEVKSVVKDFRQVCRYEECLRSVPLQGQAWHFIPQIPELTICPECFSTFVFPLRDRPVASLVNRSMQLVPGTDARSLISCQLYSERMREAFNNAVANNDLDSLAKVARRRYTIERLLKQKMLLIDEAISRGEDREAELRDIDERWKAVE